MNSANAVSHNLSLPQAAPKSAQAILRRLRIRLPVVAIAVAALGCSLVISFFVWRWEERAAQLEFSVTAENHLRTLQKGLDDYLRALEAVRAYFESSDEISREEFESFANRMLISQKAVQNLSWVPLVRRDERVAHERAGFRDHLPDYQIKTRTPDDHVIRAEDHEEYLPIFYSTLGRTSQIYGIDLLSHYLIGSRIERARDNDTLSVVPDIALQSQGGNVHGFLFSLPVYHRGTLNATVEDRRRNLAGFVHGAFMTAAAIDQIFTGVATHGLDLSLFPAEAGPYQAPIYVRQSGRGDNGVISTGAVLREGRHFTGTLTAGEVHWRLIVTPSEASSPFSEHIRTWIVLIASLLMSGLIVLYTYSSVRHRERLLQANREISKLANRDVLTGLFNRRAFNERLAEAFAQSRRTGHDFSLLYFDLDHFKDVNDTLGHPIGDRLLQMVTERVRSAVRRSDVVARFGGDEFAVLLQGADISTAMTLGGRINEILARSFVIGGNEVHVTASIGVAHYSAETASADSLITQADLALYRAKAAGRNCLRLHKADYDREVLERVSIADDLRYAVERGEMRLYYQPQVDLNSSRVVGVEALLRWNHPTRGLLSPGTFIHVAEQTGRIVALGEWVIDEACRQLREWSDAGVSPELVAVNVSASQFKADSNVEEFVMASIEKWGVNPSALEIELTESVLMEVSQQHSDSLDHLRKSGVRIAIDDFGTGYSSLKYLTIYPVNRLKVAQELVFGVIADRRNATVVRAAISLAAELGIECLAEGVENAEQALFLTKAGCLFAQGYHFGKPIDADAMTRLLKKGRLRPDQAKPRLKLVAG